MIETVHERYGIRVEVIYSGRRGTQSMVASTAPTVLSRDLAAHALLQYPKSSSAGPKAQDLKAWAVGLRRSQNDSRAGVPKVDLDAAPVKISPLADWTPSR